MKKRVLVFLFLFLLFALLIGFCVLVSIHGLSVFSWEFWRDRLPWTQTTAESTAESTSSEDDDPPPAPVPDGTLHFSGLSDDIVLPDLVAPAGTPIDAPTLDSAAQRPGWGLAFYRDQGCRQRFLFDTMPAEGATLYVRWEKEAGTGFLAWEDPLSRVLTTREDVFAFFDYILFTSPAQPVTVAVDLPENTDVNQLIANIRQHVSFLSYDVLSAFFRPDGESVAKGELEVRVKSHIDTVSDLKHAPDCGTVFDRFLPAEENGITHALPIETLVNSYPVNTGDQLYYVAIHGYRPLPEAGSSAQKIWEAAKTILMSVIRPDMTSYEKALALYDWLVCHVQYDLITAANGQTEYDAHYMEGVFFTRQAVCDGFAKAYALLCNMEGVPCVAVTGNNHAWCKVKTGGCWSIADPTYGRILVDNNDSAVMCHLPFLQTEIEKAKSGYVSLQFEEIVADTARDYYALFSYQYQGKSADLVIESAEELADFFSYLTATYGDLSGSAVDFRVPKQEFADLWKEALTLLMNKGEYFPYEASCLYQANDVVILRLAGS